MPARTLAQWLEMIGRTRPDPRAAEALGRELASAGSLVDERDRQLVQAAIEELRARAPLPSPDEPGPDDRAPERLELEVDYRPEAQGGAGRLFLEGRGRRSLLVGVPHDLTTPGVYLFSDEHGFSGLQVDDANSLPERLSAAIAELRPLALPPVDLPDGGLEDIRVEDALAWACREVIEQRRPS